ncbi:MAG: hypothetical protein HY096_08935 [Nitrospinae bacterium]|nr:hypothetical protein [Nitrospinota bacterium]MBI5750285.1 hypothetical protein [Nitrospinota bacterium]
MRLLKENFLHFFNTFDFSDLLNLISNKRTINYLLNWKFIAVIVVLCIISIFERWRGILLNVIYNIAIFSYIFIVLVILKNSDIGSAPVFLFMITNLAGAIGISVYRYLMK